MLTHRLDTRKMTSTARHIATELQADMHRQVHVHSGTPCKFKHYMHACFARNYPEAQSHCGHGHDLTSVAQLFVINIVDIRSAVLPWLTQLLGLCKRGRMDMHTVYKLGQLWNGFFYRHKHVVKMQTNELNQ